MLKHTITFAIRLPEPPDAETRRRLAEVGVTFPDDASMSHEVTRTVPGFANQSEAVGELQRWLAPVGVAAEVKSIETSRLG